MHAASDALPLLCSAIAARWPCRRPRPLFVARRALLLSPPAAAAAGQPTPAPHRMMEDMLDGDAAPSNARRGTLAAGTPLMLYEARVDSFGHDPVNTVNVEDLVVGMRLMGPDSQPKVVTDVFRSFETQMVIITPSDDAGRSALTVSRAHRLLLRVNSMPHPGGTNYASRPFGIKHYAAAADGKLDGKGPSFDTERRRNSRLRVLTVQQLANPLRWEGTVSEFLDSDVTPKSLHRDATLSQPGVIDYPQPAQPFEAVVITAMVDNHGHSIIPEGRLVECVLRTAYEIGLWLADGDAAASAIAQGGPVFPEDGHHQEAMDEMVAWGEMIGRHIEPHLKHNSSAGNPVFVFHLGKQFKAILKAYDLINNKHIPLDLLTADVEVRMYLLAGILDGDGCMTPSKLFALPAKSLSMCEQYQQLARSLGFRVGAIAETTTVDTQTGQWYDGHRIHISGNNLRDLNPYLRIGYKECPPLTPNCNSNCWGFKLTVVNQGMVAHGFTLEGGKQDVLVADFTEMQVAGAEPVAEPVEVEGEHEDAMEE